MNLVENLESEDDPPKEDLVGLYYFQSSSYMKVKCSHCNGITNVTLDKLIFENEDEELFVTYLATELAKSR